MPYNHQEIEKKWQARWEADSAFRADASKKSKKGNLYILDMFPYPSGAGLHVGHPEGYTATDITARKRRMEGFNVLHPMGWDAFGLPAENYAIKMGGHPRDITRKNIDNFRRQIKSFGFSYDWDREISTCEPEYYKWTQWLFLLLWKNDLAYRAKAPVNWCPTDNTVLANEQVVDGKCDRCGSLVVQKELEQWFFRITKYTDRLLAGLDKLDWPERIKAMQRNWIGKSEGVEIDFDVIDVNPPPARGGVATAIGRGPATGGGGGGRETVIRVFTTRPDTLMGVSYIVLAPEHPLLDELVTEDHQDDLVNYRDQARKKSELERTQLEKDKAGIFTGAYAHHPLTGELVPIWVSDYVLTTYGTGAVMGVPAHDERDYAFAKKYDLPIKWVVASPDQDDRIADKAYTDLGILVNSGMFDGLTSTDAKQKVADALEGEENGRRVTFYRIRDWLVSRQRYWGAPIPAIWCEDCGAQPVPAKDLPVVLPDDVDFKPTGQSPLVGSKSFHEVNCPKCGNAARRESDTMDTFVDSSWYFLRYTDPTNTEVFADEASIKAWCPVDLYVGGAEHAVLHLLYSRFVCYALKDLGYLDFDEPFVALRNQGLILGPDGEKMSKSKGNVVNPDEIVSEYGADTLRLYEMFMGPLEDAKPWDTKGVVGVRRFLDKVWMARERLADSVDPAIDKAVAKCVKRVGDDTDAMKFNTAIAEMMKCANVFAAAEAIPREAYMTFVRTMAPYAPHLAEELWEELSSSPLPEGGLRGVGMSGHQPGVFEHGWPVADESLLKDLIVAVAVQVNGKLRATIDISPELGADEARARAEATENVAKHLEGKEVKKVVYVAGRVINFIVV